MQNILIGSRAMNFHYLSPIKETTDWDVVSSFPIEGCEFHDRSLLNNDELHQYTTESDFVMKDGNKLHVLSPVGLAVVKRSHLWRTLGFSKHITHWYRYLKVNEKYFTESDLDFLKVRTKMTKEQYPERVPDLTLSTSEFFNDAVTKVYLHDAIHELARFDEVPMYTKLQKNPDTVMCSNDLWSNLSYPDKLKCVLEETYVISVERFLVPKQWEYPLKLAFIKALEKVCTTLSSGTFRDFCIDEYSTLIESYDDRKLTWIRGRLEALNINNPEELYDKQ